MLFDDSWLYLVTPVVENRNVTSYNPTFCTLFLLQSKVSESLMSVFIICNNYNYATNRTLHKLVFML